MKKIEWQPTEELGSRLRFKEDSSAVAVNRNKPFASWNMHEDDAPILRYLFRNARPGRHLEFGTWQGFGTLCCLEECAATVWTINLPDGEILPDGSWAYSQKFAEDQALPSSLKKVSFHVPESSGSQVFTYYQTDSLGFIGRLYREAGLGHRVCQIFCDSQAWDTSNYPAEFFDMVFVDGSHITDIVMNDTMKSMAMLRPGGLILWHDYYPRDYEGGEVSEVVQGVSSAIDALRPRLESDLSDLFWIEKSQLLLGVRS